MNEDFTWSKIRLLYTSLQKANYWYTGLSIKKYLKTKVFSLKENFQNQTINSGRWSAYCHYSQITAFKNLLEKNYIKKDSKVLIHPLLPSYLVDVLTDLGVNLRFLDLDKKTLNFDTLAVDDFLMKNRLLASDQKIDLVIAYGINGLYEEILDLANKCFLQVIPVLTVIENSEVNSALLHLFEGQKLGSILWSWGDSFFDDQLDTVVEEKLPSQPWFVSWHFETRTRAILEYHLSESHEQVLPIMEAFLYILLAQVKQQSLIASSFRYGLNKLLFKTKFANVAEARKRIQTDYPKLFDLAVPEVIFDLEINFPVQKQKYDPIIYRQFLAKTKEKSKNLYDLFSTRLSLEASGSLEIPDFYLDREYLNYFVYVADTGKWHQFVQEYGFLAVVFSPISNLVLEHKELTNANLVAKYALLVKVQPEIS